MLITQGSAMFKTFFIAVVFVAAGGTMSARAQTDSTTAAGPSVEQNTPQTVPCPPPDCPQQTHRSIAKAQPSVCWRHTDQGLHPLCPAASLASGTGKHVDFKRSDQSHVRISWNSASFLLVSATSFTF
jgi:hypothetical protein